ncbi:MAG: hypothetical protein KC657_31795 [Myxococcales bacterium]|nr:hypothetical protein [Myxococcales bacterium]
MPVGATPFGARYLNARLGRWMSPDPLSVHAAAADLNVYAYVGGRVASHVDPWGLDAMPIPSAPPEGPPDATYTHDNGTTVSMWCGGCYGGESFGAPAGAPMEAFTLGMPETLANQVSHGAAAGAGRTAGRETPASGSRARIPARPYASPGAAAFAALARYNGYSIDNEVELAGLIYEATEIIDGAPVKRYYHTPAVDTFKNTPETSHPIEARPLIPRGGKVVGMFHTHAKHVPGRHAALRPNQTNGQGWIFGPWSPQDHSALQTMVDRGIMPSDGISALATSSGHFSIINTGTPLGGEQYFFSSNLYVNWSGISSQWSGPWYLNQAGKLLPPR